MSETPIMTEAGELKPEHAVKRLVHMHIPKTAGTAVRTALSIAADRKLRIFPHYEERQFLEAQPEEWDVFSGHFGFKTATRLNGNIITLLRHPVDRFISVYYFWRELLEKKVEVSRKTKLTKLYSLDDFVSLHDEWMLTEEFFNRMTWQVAYGSTIEHRRELRDQGKTDGDLLAMALHNLESFALVGLQSRLGDFASALHSKFGLSIKVNKVNATESRPSVEDVAVATRRRIYDWVYLDMELYEAASHLFGKPS